MSLRVTTLYPLIAGLLAGCAAALSPAVRREASPIQGLSQVREHPEAYEGKTVILGGEILENRNRPDETVLLVLDRPLTALGKPRLVDETGGRFLVRFAQYLDPAVFSPGRVLSVAGVVKGAAEERVGESSCRYVVLEGREHHLWPSDSRWTDGSLNDFPWWYEPSLGRRPW